MGFMDKAKKMAEQAQTKLDDAQKQFNERQGSGGATGSGAAPVEYDSHGRPMTPAAGVTPPHGDPVAPQAPQAPVAGPHAGEAPAPQGDPLAPAPPAQAAPPPTPAPPAPAPPPAPSSPDASMSRPDDAGEDRNNPGHEPPKLSSGDPLAG